MSLYPLTFKPVYKDYPWGNTRLPALLGRSAPEGIYAESWEISTHRDGESLVANGEWAGRTFAEVLKANRNEVLGTAVEGDDFPLLIKLIDAAHPLSVQVHPNNGNAAEVQGEPKTEMWYFLHEEPAKIYCGLQPGTTRLDFEKAIEEADFESILRTVPAHRGEAVFVPGGRVHAIDTGCLILEIQQNSNTTYRVYDWGRMGHDGKPRELHIDKALQVIDFEDRADPVCKPVQRTEQITNICTSDFFVLDELRVESSLELVADGQSFHALFSADTGFDILYGDGAVESIARGASVMVPACLGAYTLKTEKSASILKTSVPVK
ncbi:MAG: hypothetical protein CBE26_03380 [Kiritimatiellaceae bacterium TMED266]|nr:MAG: hypothetical protein CBE26_03380 [Kiritimatiellaceae bacterium TMED266]